MFVHSFLIVSATVPSFLVSALPSYDLLAGAAVSAAAVDTLTTHKSLFGRKLAPRECPSPSISAMTETATTAITEVAIATVIYCSSSATTGSETSSVSHDNTTSNTSAAFESTASINTSVRLSTTSTSTTGPTIIGSPTTDVSSSSTLSTSLSTVKFSATTASSPSGISSAASSITTPYTSTTSISPTAVCYGGSAPKSTQTASNGDVFGVCPGNDFYGGDLLASSADSLTSCIEACTKTNGCIAAALTRGICYVKGTRNDASINEDVYSIYKIFSPTTSATKTSQNTGACVGGTAPVSTSKASNGDVYGICPGADFYGGDMQNGVPLPDIQSCNEACSKKTNCIAVAFTSGICYLKSIRNAASLNTNGEAAYKISSASHSTTISTPTSKAIKCKMVTSGSLCPSTEVYHRKGKTICNISSDEAATKCALAPRGFFERRAEPCPSPSLTTTTTTITTTVRIANTVSLTTTGSGGVCSSAIVTLQATTTVFDPETTTTMPNITSTTIKIVTTASSSTTSFGTPSSSTIQSSTPSSSVSSSTTLFSTTLISTTSTTSSITSLNTISSSSISSSTTSSSTTSSMTGSSATSLSSTSSSTTTSSTVTAAPSTTTATSTPTACGMAAGKIFRIRAISTNSLINNKYIIGDRMIELVGTYSMATKYVMNADCTLTSTDTGRTAVVAQNLPNMHTVGFMTDQDIASNSGTSVYTKIQCSVSTGTTNAITCSGDGANQLYFLGPIGLWGLGLARTVASSLAVTLIVDTS